MTVTIDRVKCACSDCVCVVGVDQGVKHDGQIYRSDECANHHVKGDGCHHAGCKGRTVSQNCPAQSPSARNAARHGRRAGT
jgi:metallothionein